MRNGEKKKDKRGAEDTQTVDTEMTEQAAEGELSEVADVEAEMESIGIDRESMSDEEYISALEQRLGQSIAEAQTCRALTQRLQADFDNYRKRNKSIGEDMKSLGESVVIEKMLSVLDNCDLARKYLQDEAALTGFNMMESQILTALDGFGLKEIEAEGKEFDAKTMNAVEREKHDDSENMVVAVLAKGYSLKGKLLRPASVKVSYKGE